MALLTEEQKQVFDTTFTAQYDNAGDNSLLNPQPLQVDGNGYLLVNQQGITNAYVFQTPEGDITQSTAGKIEGTEGTNGENRCAIIGGMNNQQGVGETKANGIYKAISTDNYGALDVGGININNIPDEARSLTRVVSPDLLDDNIMQMRYDLIQDGLTNFTRMYAFTQNITALDSTHVLVNISCYFSN